MPVKVEGTWGESPLGRWEIRDVGMFLCPVLRKRFTLEFGVPRQGTRVILPTPYGTVPQILGLQD